MMLEWNPFYYLFNRISIALLEKSPCKFLLGNIRVPVGARGVQRRPGVRVEQVDVGAVADQDLQHVEVVVEDGLVYGGQT